jgi:hypothetical protein
VQVSVYDTINKAGNYTAKVRMLGQFHRQLGASKEPDGMDINDPLYGNVGGEDEQVAIRWQLIFHAHEQRSAASNTSSLISGAATPTPPTGAALADQQRVLATEYDDLHA